MKKKFFSKLLMGALLVATVSSYVSCKDYDDDIANLQSQIDKKAALADLDALKQQITDAQNSASAALAAAQASLQAQIDGKADKSAVDAAIADVKATAEAAGTKAGQAIADAAAAKTAADEAKTDAAKAATDAKAYTDEQIAQASKAAKETIEAALAGYATKEELAAVEAKLKQVGDAQAELATAKALNDAVKELNDKIEKLEKAADLDGYKAQIDELGKGVNALWSAVTSVSLYVSSGMKEDNGDTQHHLHSIDFKSTTMVADVKFPTDANVVKEDPFEFKKGVTTTIKNNSILIRVSPVNAVITKDMVKLINSKGVELSENLIEITGVERYKDVLTAEVTRADEEVKNNGLWKVTFELKSGYDQDEFAAAAGPDKKAVLYAVAVSTPKYKEEAADRSVISEYDLYLSAKNIDPTMDFTVNKKNISELFNRYIETETQHEPTKANGLIDYEWTVKNNKVQYQATWAGKDDPNSRVGQPGIEDRHEGIILNVDVNDPISIKFPKDVRGFYVTIDDKFAVESGVSELAAWRGYEYENVGVKKADGTWIPGKLFDGNEGTIKVKDLGGKNDYIGFRVFAVNYDGTLCDPDGRAFYVYVGGNTQESEVPAITVKVETTDPKYSDGYTIAIPAEANDLTWTWAGEYPLAINGTGKKFEKTKTDANELKAAALDGSIHSGIIDKELFKFEYSKKSNEGWSSLYDQNNNPNGIKIAEIKYVRVQLSTQAIQSMIDDKTYTVVLTCRKKLGDAEVQDLAKITVNITKTIPGKDELPKAFSVKQNQQVSPLKVYVKPTDGGSWSALAASGYTEDIKPYDFADIFNGIQDANGINGDYEFVIKEINTYNSSSKKLTKSATAGFVDNGSGTKTGMQLLEGKTNWSTDGKQGLIATSYSVPWADYRATDDAAKNVNVSYKYRGISVTPDETNENIAVVKDFTATKENYFTVQYICALNLNRIKESTLQYQWCQAVVNAGVDMTNYPNGKNFDYSKNTDAERKAAEKLMNAYFEIPYEKTTTIEFAKSTYWDLQKDDLTLLGVTEKGFAARSGLPVPADWTKTVAAADATTLADLLAGGYVSIVANSIKVTGGVDQYFEVTQDGNVGIKFKPLRSEEKPALKDPIPFTLSFDVQDVFGHKKTLSFNWGNKLKMAVPEASDTARGL